MLFCIALPVRERRRAELGLSLSKMLKKQGLQEYDFAICTWAKRLVGLFRVGGSSSFVGRHGSQRSTCCLTRNVRENSEDPETFAELN